MVELKWVGYSLNYDLTTYACMKLSVPISKNNLLENSDKLVKVRASFNMKSKKAAHWSEVYKIFDFHLIHVSKWPFLINQISQFWQIPE